MHKNTKKRIKNKQDGKSAYAIQNTPKYVSFESARFTFFDPEQFLILKYTDRLTISLATVTATTYVYNLNGCFDPDRTGTGHQPYGYDIVATLYNRYRVRKTKWAIVFAPSSSSYNLGVLPLNGLLAASPVDSLTFLNARENPRCKGWIQGASGQSYCKRGGVNLASLNGVQPVEYLADDRFESAMTANPTEVMVLELLFYNPGGSTITINVDVTIEFYVDIHDPISLGGSAFHKVAKQRYLAMKAARVAACSLKGCKPPE